MIGRIGAGAWRSREAGAPRRAEAVTECHSFEAQAERLAASEPVQNVELSGDARADELAELESFFASLTKDLLRRRQLRSRLEARTAVFEYIETFFNRIRLHSTLDYLSPVDYEKMKEDAQQEAA
jgi:putative transposase